jgi:hypothetical protein
MASNSEMFFYCDPYSGERENAIKNKKYLAENFDEFYEKRIKLLRKKLIEYFE